MATKLPSARKSRSLLKLGANVGCFLAVVALVLFGVWVAGGVITDNFHVAAVLTGAWFAVAGLAALVAGRRVRRLRAGVWGGYALTAAAVSVYLGVSMFRDRVADERVVVGTPVAEM